MLQIYIVIFALILSVKGECSLNNEQKINDICSTDVLCDFSTENMVDLIKNWNCRKTGRRYFNSYYGQYDDEIASDYNLNVYITDVYFSDDPLIGVDENSRIKILNIHNGNLVSVPTIIHGIVGLTELSITNNKLETINLRMVSGVSMTTVNVSHNCISTIEVDVVESALTSSITKIDLSYNELESIPDNCFETYSYLKYLDLSFNKLKEFGILTFEGITQLVTLQLSNNKISEIGQNLARFRNLKDLYLDNNELTSLKDLNFRTLTSLEKLNLSSNFIKHIEDQSLATLTNLEQLDLTHNKINIIHQNLFENNIKLFKLSLSHNDIHTVERGAFRTTHVSYFDIQNNFITGSIDYDTLLGISVETLDLSNGNLKKLGDKAFSALSHDLRHLNLSTNLIENITESAFQSLELLLTLDLSCNHLFGIYFNTSDLKQLKEYYLHDNLIKKVNSKMFTNMTNLLKLDLSRNKIEDIEPNSFIGLINLVELNISNNFVDSLSKNTFRGLYRVINLDLSNTQSTSCLNESFSGMTSLLYLNLSYSLLEKVEYEAFKTTGAIKILDLSHNMLENFNINTSSISNLSKLYLNHNKLKNITTETFKNLHQLDHLNIACNNLLYIESSGLRVSSHLHYLDLFSNYNLQIHGDILNDLTLSQVSLRNVQQSFDFKNAMNVSVTILFLSNCEIEDINSVLVYKIRNVRKLDISTNKIKALDKGSFQNMDALNWLDISFNMISTIQPGTFLSNHMINTLNLYSNNLKSLKFGVLDGLKNLRVFNLSNNEIHTFGVNLLHTTPFLTELFLENNNLESIDFRALKETSVETLTIGGNSISCDVLANWKKQDIERFNITAERFDFNSENIHGISCKSKTSFSPEKIQNGNNYINNITNDVSEMKISFGQFDSYLRVFLNETLSKIVAILKKNPENLDKFAASLNLSQVIFYEQLKQLNDKTVRQLNENKNLLPQLVNTSDNVANELKVMISLLEMNNNLTKLGNIHKELLQTSGSNMTVKKYGNGNLTNSDPKQDIIEPLEVKLDKNTLADIKALLYFMSVCLAIAVLFSAVALTYKYLYRQTSQRIRINHLYDSRQTVSNGIQME